MNEICEFCHERFADGVIEEKWICIECYDRLEYQFVEDLVISQ